MQTERSWKTALAILSLASGASFGCAPSVPQARAATPDEPSQENAAACPQVPSSVPEPKQQTPGPVSFTSIAGVWEGKILTGPTSQLRARVEVVRLDSGEYFGRFHSLDQGSELQAHPVTVEGSTLRFELPAVNGVFEGQLDSQLRRAAGSWQQSGAAHPFTLDHVSSELAEPAPVVPEERSGAPFSMPLAARLLHAPRAFRGQGEQHLAYELVLTNLYSRRATLASLDIQANDESLLRLEGARLERVLEQFGQRRLQRAHIDSGQSAIAYLWVTLPEGQDVPERLSHRLEVRVEGYSEPVTAQLPPSWVDDKPVRALGPPLRGGVWVAGGSASNHAAHRRALIATDGVMRIAQRFATDWSKRDLQGRIRDGDGRKNESFFGYQAEVLAVADARVVDVVDGIPNNERGSRAVAINLDTIAGNSVTLDLGDGSFALYAHLDPGSIRVAPGEPVAAGQVIALLGNSGNSTGPHLHFHLSDSAVVLGGEGLPYVLKQYQRLPPRHSSAFSPDEAQTVVNEAPMLDEAVFFPE